MQVQIVNVEIEVGKPGAKGWSKAIVTYNFNGDTRRQNVMSFSNPAVYKAVQQHIGETVDVSITKNAKGYDEWAAVTPVAGTGQAASAPTAATTSGATRVTGSNYETPVERAKRQVLIVRQSSLTAALAYLKENSEGTNFTIDDVKGIAQEFVDFVFDTEEDNGPTE